MKRNKISDIQLIITAALKKEIPKNWLESHDVPVHSLAALKSGALQQATGPSRGMLVIITGVGPGASEDAALWIRETMTPLFVVNIGTCGVTDKNSPLSSWIMPGLVSDKDNTITLDPRLPLPYQNVITKINSLISVENPVPGKLPASFSKHDAIDMECYAQAKVFNDSTISFHCLKFSTDYSDHNTLVDFNRNISKFSEAFKSLFSFITRGVPGITAVVPVYNREQTVMQAIDSILSQSCPPEEIIVVDDCSNDGTGKILEIYGSKITPISLSKNMGPAHARNEGVKHAKTEWIAFMDSDDYWEKKKLEDQIRFIMKYPFYQILQSEEKWVRKGVRVNPCKHHKKPEGWIFDVSLERCLVSPSAVLLKKSLFDRYGGFDEELPVCEDYDLWLKISRHHPVGLEPVFNVIKRGGHKDQLSTKYPAMDRFRVSALTGILKSESNPVYRKIITSVLKMKLNILIKGYTKRDNTQDAEKCRGILKSINKIYNR
jgi:glycosyltransferase involved in cell wall biosynthesis/nucleoside phosphorylase